LIILFANNYMYYTSHLIELLPLVQKVSFLLVLLWISLLHLKIISESKSQN